MHSRFENFAKVTTKIKELKDENISNINGINTNIKDVEMDENILKLIEKNRKIANYSLGVPLYSINRDIWIKI